MNIGSKESQDLFAWSIIGKKGYFLDLGSKFPKLGNNTWLLEQSGWSGILVDIDKKFIDQSLKERSSKAFCLNSESKELIDQIKKTRPSKHFDYISFDVDSSAKLTLDNLLSENVKFSCMTFEHDCYRLGNNLKEYSRSTLKEAGYFPLFSDVLVNGLSWEDWWVDLKVISEETKSLATENISHKDAIKLLYQNKTNKFMSNTLLAPRKFDLLRRHSISTSGIEGDIIEVGLFRGGSFAMLCETNPFKHVYGFDTFEGLPQHSPEDNKHVKGEFSDTNKEAVENLVAHLDNHTIQKGRFPQNLSIDLSDKKFSLAHIDVDLYQEHINVLNYLYDKVVKNGRIVFDDYNHANCLGAKKAVDLFFKDKPEEIITSNTSQAYVIKK